MPKHQVHYAVAAHPTEAGVLWTAWPAGETHPEDFHTSLASGNPLHPGVKLRRASSAAAALAQMKEALGPEYDIADQTRPDASAAYLEWRPMRGSVLRQGPDWALEELDKFRGQGAASIKNARQAVVRLLEKSYTLNKPGITQLIDAEVSSYQSKKDTSKRGTDNLFSALLKLEEQLKSPGSPNAPAKKGRKSKKGKHRQHDSQRELRVVESIKTVYEKQLDVLPQVLPEINLEEGEMEEGDMEKYEKDKDTFVDAILHQCRKEKPDVTDQFQWYQKKQAISNGLEAWHDAQLALDEKKKEVVATRREAAKAHEDAREKQEAAAKRLHQLIKIKTELREAKKDTEKAKQNHKIDFEELGVCNLENRMHKKNEEKGLRILERLQKAVEQNLDRMFSPARDILLKRYSEQVFQHPGRFVGREESTDAGVFGKLRHVFEDYSKPSVTGTCLLPLNMLIVQCAELWLHLDKDVSSTTLFESAHSLYSDYTEHVRYVLLRWNITHSAGYDKSKKYEIGMLGEMSKQSLTDCEEHLRDLEEHTNKLVSESTESAKEQCMAVRCAFDECKILWNCTKAIDPAETLYNGVSPLSADAPLYANYMKQRMGKSVFVSFINPRVAPYDKNARYDPVEEEK